MDISREGFYDLDLISAHPRVGGPGKIPEILSAASPGGPGNGAQSLDVVKKMDPSRSPMVKDRSEIKSDRERGVCLFYFRPRGPQIYKFSPKTSILGQIQEIHRKNRLKNPSLYPP